MYHLIGFEKNLENIILLSSISKDIEIKDELSLKAAYKNFLKINQPEMPIFSKNVLELEFVTDVSIVSRLIKLFNVDSALNDIENEIKDNHSKNSEKLNYIQKKLSYIFDCHPSFYQLFLIAINALFYAKSSAAGGGTTSIAIGVIWIDFRESWSDQDHFEFFVHELGHTLLFLDERRYQHYQNLNQIIQKENYAMSAILRTKRPLDKVVHSIIVATEVLQARHQFLGHPDNPKLHPPSENMIESTLAAIQSVKNMSNLSSLLTERALDLINLCHDSLLQIKAYLTYNKRRA